MIKHGIYINESGAAPATTVEGYNSVPVVIGTAPVNRAGEALVNTPVLANSAAEAMELMGYSDDFEKYTLCQMMYVTKNVFPVAPVVYINVLDPEKHKTAVTASLTVSVQY